MNNFEDIDKDIANILKSLGVSEKDIDRAIDASIRMRERHERIILDYEIGVIAGQDLMSIVGKCMKQLHDEWLDILGQDTFNKFMGIPDDE